MGSFLNIFIFGNTILNIGTPTTKECLWLYEAFLFCLLLFMVPIARKTKSKEKYQWWKHFVGSFGRKELPKWKYIQGRKGEEERRPRCLSMQRITESQWKPVSESFFGKKGALLHADNDLQVVFRPLTLLKIVITKFWRLHFLQRWQAQKSSHSDGRRLRFIPISPFHFQIKNFTKGASLIFSSSGGRP